MRNARKKLIWRRDDTELALLALPTTVWYILFCYLPMFGILIAFINFHVNPEGGFIGSLLQSEFVGLDNFKFLFSSNDIWLIVRNTLLYNITFIILGILIPVTCAIMISQLWSKKLAKVFQTAMFLPHFLSWSIVTVVVWGFLSYDRGFFNNILWDMGAPLVQWYQRADLWPFFLIFLGVWKSLGYGMVVYLAAITGIDSTYYEAAVIDGATKWQQARYITLPTIRPVIVLMFILAVGRIFYSDFGLFYLVPRDSNSLYNVAYTIDVFVYKQLQTATVGMASASAFVQSVIGCLTILAANWVVRKVDPESAMI
ncbi:MAG: ABC transporter permease subunit [Clostridiales bacterium]|jgi:putative aldouronate transport system permease protein|nr:ABC transporter permease subunit [Clostridiales bacterium]